jgi:hypothetical protein
MFAFAAILIPRERVAVLGSLKTACIILLSTGRHLFNFTRNSEKHAVPRGVYGFGATWFGVES